MRKWAPAARPLNLNPQYSRLRCSAQHPERTTSLIGPVSVQNGFPFLHRISWDAYNEGDDLIAQAEKYKQDNGCYPERICADCIYINAKNRNYCIRNGIRLSGKRLGRPPKDPVSDDNLFEGSRQTG